MKELLETSLIGIGEDACLFSIKYDGNDDKFSKPIRLVGNVLVFCVKGSVHMSVNLNEYDVREGSLMILTDQDIVKEIVFRHNFSNQTVFYKYFKAHSGMTPTEYRDS